MNELYTIGYEGSDIETFIQTLINLRIEVLADVRELPLSRKKGFSKNGLKDRLAAEGIEYIHFKKLGDPKPGRDAAKRGDFSTFRMIFNEHMQKNDTIECLKNLLEVASKRRTCMLCFEKCAANCHRSIISNEAMHVGFDVLNLVADRPEKYLVDGIKIPRHNFSESISAAE